MSGLDAGVDHIEVLAERLATGAVSFSAGDPDAEVLGLLQACRSPEGPERSGAWVQARAGLDQFLARLEDRVQHLAVQRGPEVAGWIGWGGSTRVVLRSGAAPAEVSVQLAALRADADQRLRDLRLLVATLGAAARVATRLALPGGALWALPVVFQYLHTLVDPSP